MQAGQVHASLRSLRQAPFDKLRASSASRDSGYSVTAGIDYLSLNLNLNLNLSLSLGGAFDPSTGSLRQAPFDKLRASSASRDSDYSVTAGIDYLSLNLNLNLNLSLILGGAFDTPRCAPFDRLPSTSSGRALQAGTATTQSPLA